MSRATPADLLRIARPGLIGLVAIVLAAACVLYVRSLAHLTAVDIITPAPVAIAAEVPPMGTTAAEVPAMGTDEPPLQPFGAGFIPHDRLARYTAQPGRHSMMRTAGTGDDYGGVSDVSPSTMIYWRIESRPDPRGASVAAVLEAVAVRLSAIQNTPQASDANARALWEVMKALEVLEGLEPTK
jgi:hypothetical protein